MKGEIDLTGSSYAKRLSELKAKPCHLLKEVGDQWRTPDWLYWGVFANFGPFVIDLFSDGDNAKCGRFYTAKDNALVQDWTKDLAGGKGFFNPPYSRSSYEDGQAITGMRNIIDKVMAEREKGAAMVGVIKAATSEVWWPEEADRVVFIRGRIGFELPEWFIPADDDQKNTGASFASAICIFDKSYRGERIGYISREKLRQDGETLMALISQQQATSTGNGVWPKEIAEIVGLFRQADPSVVDEFGDELCALANKMHLAGYKVSATVNNIVGAIASADRTNSYENGVRYASPDC
ncbi:phage N-6-adenine-methyltransferase [Shewanella algae]|uniref:phage N-6-adenine-methyltransferase n=1 Tax=Shewanella algae TaxID=38313 RepID=UPI001AAD800B|nr:phage N-6-adenine-methyltransferase [Shewanella algae]MBO2556539.1 phage N-6-adenine-methyltransferase [Shewanella algae]MBO2573473.1 phage N-6-adenine-methyltransferase [Shewanella algae]